MNIEQIKEKVRWASLGEPTIITDGNKAVCFRIDPVNEPDNPRDFQNLGTMLCWHPRYKLGDYDKNPYGDIDDALAELVFEHVPAKDIFEYLQAGKSDSLSLTKKADGTLVFSDESDEFDFTVELPAEECDESGHQFQEFVKYIIKQMGVVDTSWLLANKAPDIVVLPIWMYEHSGIAISTSYGYPYSDRWDSCCCGFIYASKQDGVTFGAWKEDTPDKEWREKAAQQLACEVKVYSYYLDGEVYKISCAKWLEPELDDLQLCARDGMPVFIVKDNGEKYWGLVNAVRYPDAIEKCFVYSIQDGNERKDFLVRDSRDWKAYDNEVGAEHTTPPEEFSEDIEAFDQGFSEFECAGDFYGNDEDFVNSAAEFIQEFFD